MHTSNMRGHHCKRLPSNTARAYHTYLNEVLDILYLVAAFHRESLDFVVEDLHLEALPRTGRDLWAGRR